MFFLCVKLNIKSAFNVTLIILLQWMEVSLLQSEIEQLHDRKPHSHLNRQNLSVAVLTFISLYYKQIIVVLENVFTFKAQYQICFHCHWQFIELQSNLGSCTGSFNQKTENWHASLYILKAFTESFSTFHEFVQKLACHHITLRQATP